LILHIFGEISYRISILLYDGVVNRGGKPTMKGFMESDTWTILALRFSLDLQPSKRHENVDTYDYLENLFMSIA